MSSPVLSMKGVAHSFGGLEVLRNVNIEVPQGKIVGLIGPNGSGKTTCFNIVSGFLKPKGGTVRFGEADVTQWSIQQRSRAGLVRTFQTPKVFEQMTVLENLMVGEFKTTTTGILGGMFMTPSSRREVAQMHDKAMACAEEFGLRKLIDTRAGLLPAGQRRVVELARACISKPKALLLDEPSSGLNSEEIETLRHWIIKLNQGGLTIFLVSHDMGLMTVCDEVHVLYFGEVIASGSLAHVQEDQRVREAYLGM